MKHTIATHVYMRLRKTWNFDTVPSTQTEAWEPEAWPFKASESEEMIYVGEQLMEVGVPDDFDPVPKQVAALREQQAQALALYQKTVGEINERLQKLLAITDATGVTS